MKTIKPEDIHPQVYKLFDDYVHSDIDRRTFLSKASKYTAGGLTASVMLEFLSPQYAQAAQTRHDDPALINEWITYPSPKGGGKIKGLLSKPVIKKKTFPGVVVIHENRGLNPHIQDVTRRLGLEGFIALGPDALTPLGGYPGNDDDGRALQKKKR